MFNYTELAYLFYLILHQFIFDCYEYSLLFALLLFPGCIPHSFSEIADVFYLQAAILLFNLIFLNKDANVHR